MKKQVSNKSLIVLKDKPNSLSRVELFLRAREWQNDGQNDGQSLNQALDAFFDKFNGADEVAPTPPSTATQASVSSKAPSSSTATPDPARPLAQVPSQAPAPAPASARASVPAATPASASVTEEALDFFAAQKSADVENGESETSPEIGNKLQQTKASSVSADKRSSQSSASADSSVGHSTPDNVFDAFAEAKATEPTETGVGDAKRESALAKLRKKLAANEMKTTHPEASTTSDAAQVQSAQTPAEAQTPAPVQGPVVSRTPATARGSIAARASATVRTSQQPSRAAAREVGPVDVLPERKNVNLSHTQSKARERILSTIGKSVGDKPHAAGPNDILADVFDLEAVATPESTPGEVTPPVLPGAEKSEVNAGSDAGMLAFRKEPGSPLILPRKKSAVGIDQLLTIDDLLTEAMSFVVDVVVSPGDNQLSHQRYLVKEVASMDLVFRGQSSSLVGCAGSQSLLFMEELRKVLNHMLVDSSIELSVSYPVSMKMPTFDFHRWAAERCSTVALGSSEEIAVGVAALDLGQTPEGLLVPSSRAGYWRISLSKVWVDVVLDFEVHLHFPLNDKFLLYVKKGDSLTDDRKARLRDRGVNEVHVQFSRTEDVTTFLKQYQLIKSVGDYSFTRATTAQAS